MYVYLIYECINVPIVPTNIFFGNTQVPFEN